MSSAAAAHSPTHTIAGITLNAEANAPQLDGAKPVVLTGSSAPTGQPPNFRLMAALSPSASPEVNPAEMAEIRRDLEDLIAAHAPALAAEAEAIVVHKTAKAGFDAAAPRRPPVLFWRVDDPFHNPRGRERSPSNGWFQFYTEGDIEELRDGPEPCMFASGAIDSPEGPGMAWRPNSRRIARKAAILAGFDDWQAECAVVSDRVGLAAARGVFEAAAAAARAIEHSILEFLTETLAEVIAKARWIEVQDKVAEWSDYVLYDVINLGDAVEAGGEVDVGGAHVAAERSAA